MTRSGTSGGQVDDGTSVLERMRGACGRIGGGLYAAILCLITLAVLGLMGLLSHLPWLFPSLGPTVMLFFESPEQPASRPVNTLVGHGVGLLAGIACFHVVGVAAAGSAPVDGLHAPHLVAGAVSVAVTTLVLSLLGLPHPPAGATTLIVSLGILSSPAQFGVMAAAIALLTLLGWSLNLLLGTRPAGTDPRAS